MTITPNELLDTSIAQLRTLAAFLREQLSQGADRTPSAAQVRACRELLGSLSALILRLQAARETSAGGYLTSTGNGSDAIPLATTCRILGPDSWMAGTSK
jgi:hypothetical protein